MNFLKKLFSPTILIISLLLLLYTFYRSEITYSGDKRHYYLIYYIISLLLILFSIMTFFISYKMKEYIIISSLSLFVSLYLFEGYLTLELNNKFQLYEKQSGEKWDKRLPYEIYNDLKKKNNEITVSLRGTLYETEDDPIYTLAGISNSETIHCNENGYYSIYQSDRYGFNNPDKEWSSNEIEYLLVGDSFVHGSCINRPHDMGSVLRTLSNKSVLNLGYRGNGPLVEYATLREYLNPKVKKVLWVYYENDLKNLKTEKNIKFLTNYLNDINFTQNLRLKQNKIDDNLKKHLNEYKKRLEKKEKKSVLKEFITLYNLRSLIFKKEDTLAASPDELRLILKLAQNLTKKNNSKLYFIYLPGFSRYVNQAEVDKTYISLQKIVKGLGIPFIDIHEEVFKKKKNLLNFFPFEQPGHYNVKGYKKVSETIYKFTKD